MGGQCGEVLSISVPFEQCNFSQKLHVSTNVRLMQTTHTASGLLCCVVITNLHPQEDIAGNAKSMVMEYEMFKIDSIACTSVQVFSHRLHVKVRENSTQE